jgi:hypothetical protein
MNAVMRPVIVGGFMGLLAAGVFGLRFACTPMDFREIDRSAELEEMRRATLARLAARDQVVRDLIAKRYTLAEAIEQFRKLDLPQPNFIAKLQDGLSPQEKSYQYIRWLVEDALHDHPEQVLIVLRRLEQEHEKLRSEMRSSLNVP